MKHTSESTTLSNSTDKSLSGWDEAIKRARDRLAEMKRSIRGLEELREQGMEFPQPKLKRQSRKAKRRSKGVSGQTKNL